MIPESPIPESPDMLVNRPRTFVLFVALLVGLAALAACATQTSTGTLEGLVSASGGVADAEIAGSTAFACRLEGGECSLEDAQKLVLDDRTFAFSGLESVPHRVVVWQDGNGSGVVDDGDLYGESTAVTPPASGVRVSLRRLGEDDPTRFNIGLRFSPTTSEAQRAQFRAAAAIWERVITGDLSPVRLEKPADACGALEPAESLTVDDVLIYADIGPEDGPGGLLASAGPCLVRTDGLLTIYGTMRFDSADVDGPNLASTILHEMGHVLGIGTLWESFGLLEYAGPACQDASGVGFRGLAAGRAYAVLGGGGAPEVESDYGPGTKCGHWSEAVFDDELMTGFSEGQGDRQVAEPLSALTVASLEDLGYEVAPGEAEPYRLPACSPLCTAWSAPRTLATDPRPSYERLLQPRYTVGEGGELRALEPTVLENRLRENE